MTERKQTPDSFLMDEVNDVSYGFPVQDRVPKAKTREKPHVLLSATWDQIAASQERGLKQGQSIVIRQESDIAHDIRN